MIENNFAKEFVQYLDLENLENFNFKNKHLYSSIRIYKKTLSLFQKQICKG